MILNFWFTACRPCIEEMPALNRLKEHHENRILFLSMAPEKANEIHRFLEKHDFQWRIFPSSKDYISRFGSGYPKNILVDQQGIIRFIFDQIPMNEEKESYDPAVWDMILKDLNISPSGK